MSKVPSHSETPLLQCASPRESCTSFEARTRRTKRIAETSISMEHETTAVVAASGVWAETEAAGRGRLRCCTFFSDVLCVGIVFAEYAWICKRLVERSGCGAALVLGLCKSAVYHEMKGDTLNVGFRNVFQERVVADPSYLEPHLQSSRRSFFFNGLVFLC